MSNESPLMRQWLALKREIPTGAILLFRLGDFYEMFREDATVAAPICELSLTNRNRTPMCGIPCHSVCTYLAKFIRCGKTVALCDEMEGRKEHGGLIRREITRIVTPGRCHEQRQDSLVRPLCGLATASCTRNPKRRRGVHNEGGAAV